MVDICHTELNRTIDNYRPVRASCGCGVVIYFDNNDKEIGFSSWRFITAIWICGFLSSKIRLNLHKLLLVITYQSQISTERQFWRIYAKLLFLQALNTFLQQIVFETTVCWQLHNPDNSVQSISQCTFQEFSPIEKSFHLTYKLSPFYPEADMWTNAPKSDISLFWMTSKCQDLR